MAVARKRTAATRSDAKTRPAAGDRETLRWTFLTNHAHVVLCVARDPEARVRDLAEQVGITVRAVQRILGDLEEAGYLSHERIGRRKIYHIKSSLPFRHPVERSQKIAMLLAIVLGDTPPGRTRTHRITSPVGSAAGQARLRCPSSSNSSGIRRRRS